MSALLTLRNLFWAATTLAEIVLVFYLIRRKLVDTHHWLLLYLCCTVFQSALAVVTYRFLDFDSRQPETSSGAVRLLSSPCASRRYVKWLAEFLPGLSASGLSLNAFFGSFAREFCCIPSSSRRGISL